MRPDANQFPTLVSQAPGGVGVARSVGFDLGAPESGVLLWPGGMEWTPVPETPIDENRHARTHEHDVGDPSRFFGQWHLQAVAKAQGMQGPPQFDLDVRSSLSHARHA